MRREVLFLRKSVSGVSEDSLRQARFVTRVHHGIERGVCRSAACYAADPHGVKWALRRARFHAAGVSGKIDSMGERSARHRGMHPGDDRLFGEEAPVSLQLALEDYCLLLNRGYSGASALKLVGDRHGLRARQRLAVSRCSCSDQARASRASKRVAFPLSCSRLLIDGYNLLINFETALSGGVVFRARDGCFRDLASLHGTYRQVAETVPAVTLVGQFLHEEQGYSGEVQWYLDAPVSNSGRLARTIVVVAAEYSWSWNAEPVPDPDPVLAEAHDVVVTSDSWILDRCQSWCNLASEILTPRLGSVFVADLSGESV